MGSIGIILGLLALQYVTALQFDLTEEITPVPTGSHLVQSAFNIPGGFVSIDFPDSTLAPLHSKASCFDWARNAIQEPYTSHYWPRTNFTLEPPWDEVKRAYWLWDGPVTKADFDAVRAIDCNSAFYETIHYKVINGRLYTPSACQACTQSGYACTLRRAVAEEMLKVVLYLWPIPDMEFLMYFGDSCFPDRPAISLYVCRAAQRCGFSMPTAGVWGKSLGPVQMSAYHACLRHRYPASQRKPQVVWRGGSTNTVPLRKSTYMEAPRVKLHLLGRAHPDLLDTRINRLTPSVDDFVRQELNDTAPTMLIEDFNRYCAVVDLDGNGWSDRFGHSLIHFPTPVLRAATNRTAYFEHYYAPGVTFTQFKPDLSDFLTKARALVDDCRANGAGSAGQRMAENMVRTSRAYMDHIGIAEAMAYSLLAFKNASDWAVDPSLEGFTEISMACCNHTRLPPRFAELVSSRLDNRQR